MTRIAYRGRPKTNNRVPLRFDVGGPRTLTMQEIAERSGCAVSTIHRRVTYGMTGSALLAPPQAQQSAKAKGLLKAGPEPASFPKARAVTNARYDVGDGRALTMKQIAAELGCSISTVSKRVHWGVRGRFLLQPIADRSSVRRLIEMSQQQAAT